MNNTPIFTTEGHDDEIELHLTKGYDEVSDRQRVALACLKWRTVYYFSKKGFLVDENGGDTCSLCLEYSCEICPLAKFTGEMDCDKTPFYEYRNAWVNDSLIRGVIASREMYHLLRELWLIKWKSEYLFKG